jgi:ATP-dependent Clp protease ATP-binding subunit ClpX
MRFTPPTYDEIPTVAQMVATMDRTVSGLPQVKLRLALMLRRFMVSAAKGHARPPQNVVVIGPSGGGKTYLIRRLLEACPVVWSESDATAFSDVGYIGRDLTSVYLGLIEAKWRGRRGDEEPPWTQQEMTALAARWGVVVIDEFDKLKTNKVRVPGEREVGRALQTELLKLVEGVDALAKRNDDDRGVMIPTHNILHIAVGAFQGLNAIVARDLAKEGNVPENAYLRTSIINLCDYGFLEELVGRFSTIVTLPPLDAAHMARILREHVIPEFHRQCADDGITLAVDEGALSTAAQRAAGLPIGARALAPMVDDCLAPNWALALPGDTLRLTATSVEHSTSELVRPVRVAA